jgi:hypothetical protein
MDRRSRSERRIAAAQSRCGRFIGVPEGGLEQGCGEGAGIGRQQSQKALGLLRISLPASLAVRAVYGYEAFRAIGDLTSAQTRYYSALWPGFGLGAARLFAAVPAGRTRTLSAGFFATLHVLSSAFFASILS